MHAVLNDSALLALIKEEEEKIHKLPSMVGDACILNLSLIV